MEEESSPQQDSGGFKIKPITLFIILVVIIGVVLLLEHLIFDSPKKQADREKTADTTAL